MSPLSSHPFFDYQNYRDKTDSYNRLISNDLNDVKNYYYISIANQNFLASKDLVIKGIQSGKVSYNNLENDILFIREEYLQDLEGNYSKILQDSRMMFDYKLLDRFFKSLGRKIRSDLLNRMYFTRVALDYEIKIAEIYDSD
jgi:hypothetical protein